MKERERERRERERVEQQNNNNNNNNNKRTTQKQNVLKANNRSIDRMVSIIIEVKSLYIEVN